MRHLIYFFFALTLFGCKDAEPELVPERGPADAEDGDNCNRDTSCDSGTCNKDWPKGYCTGDCGSDKECNGADAFCLDFLDDNSLCLDACEKSLDCRPDYQCVAVSDSKRACVPDVFAGPVPGFAGGECNDSFQCNEGLECATDLPGGFCVDRDCARCRDVCTDEVPGVDGTVCATECRDIDDRRVGYICATVSEGDVCIPASNGEPGVPWTTTRDVLGVECNATSLGDNLFEIEFEIGNSAAFVLTTFTEFGGLLPQHLETPSQSVDLLNDYIHHNNARTSLGSILPPIGRHETISMYWSIQFPYAPQFQNLVESGRYTLTVQTQGDSPCHYVAEQTTPGSRLLLNIYFTGTELNAANAPTNPDFQEVVSTVQSIYANVGITIDDIAYFDLPEEIAIRYNQLETDAGINRLTAFGDARGASLADHLTVDVFMVDEIVGNLLGISAGLPGPPGMHGNRANGTVFSTQDIGFDNPFVGYIMAHEIAHYIGLRHTTESIRGTEDEELAEDFGLVDPLDDTPECSSPTQLYTSCPDVDNLMFPFIPPEQFRNGTLSPQQIEALTLNPLVR